MNPLGSLRRNSGNFVGTSFIDPAKNFQLEVAPNPFSGTSLQVTYSIQKASTISMSIYDLSGRSVQKLISSVERAEGLNEEVLKIPAKLPVGEYLLKLETRTGHQMIKIIKAQ